MSQKWTPEQETAIKTRNCNLLVAAAAGAGKTAVLVERIIRGITDPETPIDVDKLLVVTFTKAAAAEMRQRIGDAINRELNANPLSRALNRQLNLLNRASITTIHSFCADIIKRYFYRLDIDPSFRVADDNEAALLRLEVLDEFFEEKYALEDGDFLALADAYGGGRDDAALKDMVLQLYEFSRSHPWPEQWLAALGNGYRMLAGEQSGAPSIDDLPWAQTLFDWIDLQLEGARGKIEKALELAQRPGGPVGYIDNLNDDLVAIDEYISASSRSWEALYRAFGTPDFGRLKSIRSKDGDDELKEKVKALRDEAKGRVKDIREKFFARPPQDYLEDLARVAPLVDALGRLAIDFARAYRQVKEEKALADFSDLEHYCLQILLDPESAPGEVKPSPVALELREYFHEILVDEYQDINAVQEAILQLVSRREDQCPNLFMVGDVKQSIYRFRLAEPTLFLGKYRSYPRSEGVRARGVDLACNFRSRREVVDAVNFVFRQVMTPRVGEMPYDSQAELVCGAGYPEPPEGVANAAGPVEVYLLEKKPDEELQDGNMPPEAPAETDGVEETEELDAVQREARLIARRISQMVGDGENPAEFWVFDKNAPPPGYRPARYRDIVVLMRATKGVAETYIEEFRQAGIPAYADLGTGYFAATEVETVMSLLKIIDNPRQEIPLAAVLRSPMVGLDAGEMAKVRLCDPKGDYYDAVMKAAKGTVGSAEGSAASVKGSADTVDEKLASQLADFLTRLDRWRTLARQGSLAELIWTLYRETGFYDYCGGLPEGTQRQANLRALYDRARQYEATSFRGLFRFLRFIERFRDTGSDLGSARALGEGEDVVRVMSIHKSKGLEFPVVFLAGLGRGFNRMDTRDTALKHKNLGVGLNVVDMDLRIYYPSLTRTAIEKKIEAETLAEEMRILYVAMTRAREKLVLVASLRDLPKQAAKWCENTVLDGWHLPDADLARAGNFMDWLGPAVARHRDGEPLRQLAGVEEEPAKILGEDSSYWQVKVCTPDDYALETGESTMDMAELLEKVRELAPVEIASELTDEINNRLSWQYPHAHVIGRAAKASVSELKRRFARLELEEGEATVPGEEGTKIYSRFDRPRFLQPATGLTGAERGSATHLIMQHLDFEGDLSIDGIKEQISRMVVQDLLTREQAEAVDTQAVAGFFQTPLGQKVTAAARETKLKRELPFTMALPAGEVYRELWGDDTTTALAAEEKVLVQGVIDGLIDEGDWYILIDYKTDQIGPGGTEEIVQRYRGQMNLYARAVEGIFNKPVKEKWLFLFAIGEAVEVEEELPVIALDADPRNADWIKIVRDKGRE